MTEQAPSSMLRLKSVLTRTGLCRSTLYRKITVGTFPPQVKLGPRCVGWRASDIDDWLRNPMFYEVPSPEDLGCARRPR